MARSRSAARRKAARRKKTPSSTREKTEARGLGPLPYPLAFAFVGSGCLLALEIVGGRILAPTVGNSLYTWTSVIGVVLAGLSIGNYVGGVLADRWPGRATLSYQYLASAIAAGLILALSRNLRSVAAPADWPAALQVLWLSLLLLFLPSTLLGTVTPMLVKLSLDSLDATGRVVGKIQAAASLGAIVGVFLTGFLLISTFGTRAIVADLAFALLILAVASNPVWRTHTPQEYNSATAVITASSVVMLGIAALSLTYNNPCLRESNYYCIRVFADESGKYKQLELDALIHGIVSVQDPTRLVYPYERLYGQIVDAKYGTDRPVKAFAIGGGTYTFPRYLEKHHHGSTLVAEIDPEVTDVVRSELGLRDSPGIRVINDDARPVLRDRPKNDRYDAVLGDAFGDIAIPYHLVTREFNELVKSHLKPDGIYLANVVDGVHYDFLRSYLKTLRMTFPQVRLLIASGEGLTGKQNTFVVVSSMQPLPQTASMIPPEQLTAFLNQRDPVTLTDDHVPVDQLLEPVFRQRLHEHTDSSQAGA
jgi:predicted membrane-bound spermidine synthase